MSSNQSLLEESSSGSAANSSETSTNNSNSLRQPLLGQSQSQLQSLSLSTTTLAQYNYSKKQVNWKDQSHHRHHQNENSNENDSDNFHQDDNSDNNDDVNGDDSYKKDLFTKLNTFLHKYHLPILLIACVILIPLGIFSFPKFISSTDSTIHPIPNSPSDIAVRRFRTAFGGSVGDGSNSEGDLVQGLRNDDPLNPGMIFLLEHHTTSDINTTHETDTTIAYDTHDTDTFIDGTSNLFQMTQNFTFNLQNYLSQNLPLPSTCAGSTSTKTTSLLSTSQHSKEPVSISPLAIIEPSIDIISYYSLQKDKLPTAAEKIVAKNGNIIVLYISYSIPSCLYSSSKSSFSSSLYHPSPPTSMNLIHHNIQRIYSLSILSMIQSYTTEHLLQPQNNDQSSYHITMGYTGIVPFQNDMSISVKEDIHRLHVFILPLSLLLFCLALSGHISIILIPIFSVVCVCCAWSCIMILLINLGLLQVTQFTPNVMMSLSIGLGIDYTLFLLSRVLVEATDLRNKAKCHRKKRRRMDLYYNDPFENIVMNRNNDSCIDEDSTGDDNINFDDEHFAISNNERHDEKITKLKRAIEEEERDIQFKAIQTMLQQAGHTILVSGVTLMCTFLGLLLFPIHALQSVSIGASICIIFCLSMNLMIVPAFLHSKLGYKMIKYSRPINGGSGVDLMSNQVKRFFSTLQKKRRLWKYKARSRLSSAQAASKNDLEAISSHDDSLMPSTDNGNAAINATATSAVDETYTCFEDLLLHEEFSSAESQNPTMNRSHLSGSKLSDYINLDDSSVVSDYALIPGQGWSISDECDDEMSNRADVDITSFWFKLATQLLHPTRSIFIFIGVMIILIPIAIQTRRLKTSISFELMLPSNSPSVLTFREFGNLFGEGKVSPYRVLFDGLDYNDRIDTADAFDVMHNVMKQLEEQPGDAKSNVKAQCAGIAWANGEPISYTIYEAAKACSKTFGSCPFESSRALMKLDSKSTSKDGFSTLATCFLSENSYTENSVNWLVQSRNLLTLLNESGDLKNFTVTLQGGASIEYDAEKAVEQSLGRMVSVTLCCVFIITSLFLKSIVTPLRSVISISITLASVYGLVVIIYQQNGGYISWLTVPMSFSIIVGLGLDYDIFLINRVLEYRISGYDHHSSIVAGLCQTGKIITAAGIIMAVSFGGLLFSSSPTVYQWSFSLTMAVLLDTFVMRSCIVPILLAKTGVLSWYPRVLPPSTLSLDSASRQDHVLL